MKLIIQIPCYNEAESLPITLQDLPREVEGFDSVEFLVIDDGSTDGTSQVAETLGVHHILRLPHNAGLARAFTAGLRRSLHHGADVIVNTDADNQYYGGDVATLTRPVLSGQADIVIGARPIDEIAHFTWFKKVLQNVGSWVVRVVSGTKVDDAPSGFRAFSRHAALQLNVFSAYTYTLETIIQAGHRGLCVVSVPIRVNPDLRPSRLVKGNLSYVLKSTATIMRILALYRPMRFFALWGAVATVGGMGIGLRFVILWLQGAGQGNIQSLILAAILILLGAQLFMFALISDIISINRRLLEKIDYNLLDYQTRSSAEKNRSND